MKNLPMPAQWSDPAVKPGSGIFSNNESLVLWARILYYPPSAWYPALFCLDDYARVKGLAILTP